MTYLPWIMNKYPVPVAEASRPMFCITEPAQTLLCNNYRLPTGLYTTGTARYDLPAVFFECRDMNFESLGIFFSLPPPPLPRGSQLQAAPPMRTFGDFTAICAVFLARRDLAGLRSWSGSWICTALLVLLLNQTVLFRSRSTIGSPPRQFVDYVCDRRIFIINIVHLRGGEVFVRHSVV